MEDKILCTICSCAITFEDLHEGHCLNCGALIEGTSREDMRFVQPPEDFNGEYTEPTELIEDLELDVDIAGALLDDQGIKYKGEFALLVTSAGSGLKIAEIPEGVWKIDKNAFKDCCELEQVTLPRSLKAIGDWAFDGCENIKRVIYLGSLKEWCEIDFEGYYSNPTQYGEAELYINGEEVKEISIPDEITEIGDYAFAGTKITSVQLNNVNKIGSFAFAYCEDLRSIDLSIVSEIGSNAFTICKNLSQIGKTDSLTKIGSEAFTYTAITEFCVPSGVKEIRMNAFRACSKLRSVTVCEGVKSINQKAFSKCTSLESVILPSSVTTMSSYVFFESKEDVKITVKRKKKDTKIWASDWAAYKKGLFGYKKLKNIKYDG